MLQNREKIHGGGGRIRPGKFQKSPRKMAENTYSRATAKHKTAPVNKLHLCSLYTIAVLRSDMYMYVT